MLVVFVLQILSLVLFDTKIRCYKRKKASLNAEETLNIILVCSDSDLRAHMTFMLHPGRPIMFVQFRTEKEIKK